ncbi:MAG TPA: hypothetical protein PKA41_17540 [Verrucomicrobiota bacterium]|nr:hypothetical protein [Verrucomicrobiota bacterium]
MKTTNPRLLNLNSLLLIAATMLPLFAGCGKADAPQTGAEAVETLSVATTVVTAEVAQSPAAPPSVSKLAELPPLSDDVLAILESNKTSIVEHQIHYIVNADIAPLEKAQALFLVYSQLDASGQRKVAHSAVKYIEDEHFALVREQLFDTNLQPQVLSVFMTDTLKRGFAVKLPVLFDLARYDGHPMQTEARQLLGHYFGRDYGSNWDKWEQAMLAYLDKHSN